MQLNTLFFACRAYSAYSEGCFSHLSVLVCVGWKAAPAGPCCVCVLSRVGGSPTVYSHTTCSSLSPLCIVSALLRLLVKMLTSIFFNSALFLLFFNLCLSELWRVMFSPGRSWLPHCILRCRRNCADTLVSVIGEAGAALLLHVWWCACVEKQDSFFSFLVISTITLTPNRHGFGGNEQSYFLRPWICSSHPWQEND